MLTAVAAAAFPYVTGRIDPPIPDRAAAERAIASARASNAAIWATARHEEAETRLRETRTEDRRQELRFFVFRNFETVRLGYRVAERLALSAKEDAEHAHQAARDAAEFAVAEAAGTLAEAESRVANLRLRPVDRRRLSSARSALTAADLHWQEGRFEEAEENAMRAREDLRLALVGVGKLSSRYADSAQLERWRRWEAEAIAWSKQNRAPSIVVNKERNRLELYDRGKRVGSWPADMGQNNTSEKRHAGDNATPEGRYRIAAKRDVGQSRYHRALLLDYPNDEDMRRFRQARAEGRVPRGAGPGNLIEIHGEGGRGADWTRGCVALANKHMDALFKRVGNGTPVTIIGGDGGTGTLSTLARFIVETNESRR